MLQHATWKGENSGTSARVFGESSLLGMNYSTRDGVCSTQRQRGESVFCKRRLLYGKGGRQVSTSLPYSLDKTLLRFSLGSDEGAQRLRRQHAQVARHGQAAGVEVRRHGLRARRERGLLAHLLTGLAPAN